MRRPRHRGHRDHPRSRGVYATGAAERGEEYGSSPLARGLLWSLRRCRLHRRIIPARAGFTSAGRRRDPNLGDHPRSRGVYSARGSGPRPRRGSSPLARGLPRTLRSSRTRRGIIPARAGFTGRTAAMPFTSRIIPARAGFTRRPRSGRWGSRDHPRSRGVYVPGRVGDRANGGSSPLARGLQGARQRRHLTLGIIPARAGFTPRTGPTTATPTDHPRSRGVYPVLARPGSIVLGSSPLARGLRVGRRSGRLRGGIIPARAGFTRAAPRRWIVRWDHPRSRGVYIPP